MNAKIKNQVEKRKCISKEDALEVLRGYYQELFVAYYEGLDDYNKRIDVFSPSVRTRLDAPMLNACIADSFISHFPDHYEIGKYGRILFRWEGITMLIKKLDKGSKPSYIPTLLSDGIMNQLQIPLFNDEEARQDALLMFGYTKDGHGQLVNPRIVLYDGDVKWIASRDDAEIKPVQTTEHKSVTITLKKERKSKEA